MRIGSIVVILAASVAVFGILENCGVLRGQQNEPALVDKAEAPQSAQENKPEEKSVDIGPAGFPYSALMPVGPVEPFQEKGFKISVVAYWTGSDTTASPSSTGPTQYICMGSEKRTVELDDHVRLFTVDMTDSREIDAKKLMFMNAKERCLITLEMRGGEEKATAICLLRGDLGKPRSQDEIHKKNRELEDHIRQWRRALFHDASKGHKILTDEQVKMGKESIAMAERRLMLNAVDGDGNGLRYHTRGGVKSFDLKTRTLVLAQGGQERTWNVAKDAKVFVSTVYHMEEARPIGHVVWAYDDYDSRSSLRFPYVIEESKEGMVRLRNDSQVYLTFDTQANVQRIDIMERDRLIMPEMPWLPFPMNEAK